MVQNIEHSVPHWINCHVTYSCERSGERNKMAALGYVNTRGDKLRPRLNAVCIGLPPAPRYSPFTSVCKSSHTTWVHRRLASCARSAQIFSGKNKKKKKKKKNMKDHLG